MTFRYFDVPKMRLAIKIVGFDTGTGAGQFITYFHVSFVHTYRYHLAIVLTQTVYQRPRAKLLEKLFIPNKWKLSGAALR